MRERKNERTVIQDYWYTNAHLEDLGMQWQKGAEDRLFIPISKPGEFAEEHNFVTGITQNDVDDIKTPKKIMLPLNRGGDHWTAITADVKIAPNGKRVVKLSFTDSLGKEQSYDLLPREIKNEMSRISNLFGKDATVTTELYPYTWKQPDGSSCGPYSFANSVRCLDGKGAEPNPGREVIRSQQLDMMTSGVAIKSCSTNDKVDEVIRTWVIDQMSNDQPIEINNYAQFMEMAKHYADVTQAETAENVKVMFLTENNRNAYDDGNLVLPYIQRRMGELVASDEIISISVSADKLASIHEEMKNKNSMQKFEDMREAIASEVGAVESYKFAAEIMHHLSEMHIDGAMAKISELKDSEIGEYCLNIALEAISTRGIESNYAAKIEAQAYLAVYDFGATEDKLQVDVQESQSKNLDNQSENMGLTGAIHDGIGNEDSIQKFEDMREKVEFLLGRVESYRFIAEIMQDLSRVDVESAQIKVTELQYPAIESYCLDIIEGITYEAESVAKMEAQARNYLAIYEAEVKEEKLGLSNGKNLDVPDDVPVLPADKLAIIHDKVKNESSMQKFEDMREKIEFLVGEVESYKFIAEIIQYLSREDVEGAELKITELEYPDIISYCLKTIDEVTSEPGYASKMESQAGDYLEVYEAVTKVKEPASQERKVNQAQSEENLAQISEVLKEAISRNDAGIVQRFGYAIKDWSESIMSSLTGSVTSYQLLEKVEKELALPPVTSDITKEERKTFIQNELDDIKKKIGAANVSSVNNSSPAPVVKRSDNRGR
jgi:hypothetical protein